MSTYPPPDPSAKDYSIKPSRLNLLVPPPPSPPPPQSQPTPTPIVNQDYDHSIAIPSPSPRAQVQVQADLRRETQAERVTRVRKIAEQSFRHHQEKIKKANKDRGLDIPDFEEMFGGAGASSSTFEAMDREFRNGMSHFNDLMEPNLARPPPQAGAGAGVSSGDVRIPSRYQNQNQTQTQNHSQSTTTTTHTTTSTSSTTFKSTYTSFTTDASGRASVNITDYNLSDSQIHSRITKEMAEKRQREERARFQKDRQARKAMEEARYREIEYKREAREREQEAATRAKKKKQRDWEREFGKQYEEAQAAFRRKNRRDRRGSTPVFTSEYDNGNGNEQGSSEEDIKHTGTRYPFTGRGEGRRGSGFAYEFFHGFSARYGSGSGTGSGSGSGSGIGSGSGSSSRYRNSIQTRKEKEEKERERYLSRWKSLLSTESDETTDEIIETELAYTDIPWPIYSNSPLEKGPISKFLSNLAQLQGRGGELGGKEGGEQERKVLREAIRNFHPDRFNSKILPRVREGDREKVKEGMEICSRVLTDLITLNASSR